MNQPGGGKDGRQRPARRRRGRRSGRAQPRPEPTSPRWSREAGPKFCRKCGGRMFPADWIWQKYGLCLGWRCSQCRDKVLARSLPFKGLRKRTLDPDELLAATDMDGAEAGPPENGGG